MTSARTRFGSLFSYTLLRAVPLAPKAGATVVTQLWVPNSERDKVAGESQAHLAE